MSPGGDGGDGGLDGMAGALAKALAARQQVIQGSGEFYASNAHISLATHETDSYCRWLVCVLSCL